MKIAFTTAGDDLDASLDSRFGRAPKFLIYDLDGGEFEVRDNQQNLNAAQGAGIQAAQNVAKAGANVVVTGHCGPKAFRVLMAADIVVYHTSATTVRDALNLFREGNLKAADGADVEGHWI